MAEEQRLSAPVREIFLWGRQTIAFAMSLRAIDLGKSLDDPEQVRLAGREAHEITNKLLADAHKECGGDPVRIWQPFARTVLAWVDEHLRSD